MNGLRLACLTAVLCVAGILTASADGTPINKTCPVMRGKPIKSGVTLTYEGRTIGFCCGKCKGTFSQNPKQYLGNLPPPQAAGPAADEGAKIGEKAPDFKLKSTNGETVGLEDHKGKIVVLQWVDPKCAACLRLGSTGLLEKLALDLKAMKDDIVVLAVTSTDKVDAKALSKFLEDSRIETPCLLDPDGKVGKAYGARTNSQCFVIDPEGLLRYSGAIDDDEAGDKGDKAVNHVLAAVKCVLDGTNVSTDKTKPYGTEIKYKAGK